MKKFKQMFREHKKAFLSTAICGVLSLIAVPTFAIIIGTGQDHKIYDIISSGSRSDGFNNGYWDYNTYYKEMSDGTPAYCFNADREQPTGQNYTEGGEINNRLYTILMNGYPNKRFSNSAYADFYITQIAIWHELGQLSHGEPIRWVSTDACNLTSAQLKSTYEHLISTPNNQLMTQDYWVSYSTNSLTATWNNATGRFETPEFSLTSSESVKEVNLSISNAPSSSTAYIIGPDGNRVSSLVLGKQYRVAIPENCPGNSVSINSSGTISHKVGKEFLTPDVYYQNIGAIVVKDVQGSVATSLTVNWKRSDKKVEVIKKDKETKKPLAGASFSLLSSDKSKTISTGISGADGKVVLTAPSSGTYWIRETKPPATYAGGVADVSVTVSEGTPLVSKEVLNEQIKANIEILKTDSSKQKKPLAGAEYGLFTTSNKVTPIKKGTTGTDGKVVFSNVIYGNQYLLKEIKAPSGFKIDPTFYPITITSSNTIYKEFTNSYEHTDVTINKQDVNTKAPLNATFDIYKNGNKLSTLQVNGSIKEPLEPGDYKLIETVAPQGYVLDSTPHTFVVDGTKSSDEITITNAKIKGTVRLKKIDSKTGAPLEGVKFKIYHKGSTKAIKEVTTNSSGIADFGVLDYGNYEIQESATREEYILNTTKIPVAVTENGKIYELTATNTKKSSGLIIKKVDAKNPLKLLQGAVFELRQNGTLIKTLTTDSSGIASYSDLPYGTYTITETKAPSGYIIDRTPRTFTVDGTKKTIEIEMENKEITGSLKIVKVDGSTKKPLSGVKFELYKGTGGNTGTIMNTFSNAVKSLFNLTEVQPRSNNGTLIKSLVTDKNGEIVVEDLPLGDYYVVETETLPGYVYNPVEYPLTLRFSNEIKKMNITNNKIMGSCEITKIDSKSRANLEGATIGIYNRNNDTKVAEAVTNKDGKVSFTLPYGSYYYKEIAAPTGYLLNDTITPFNIRTNGEKLTYVLEDTKISGTLEILKLSLDKKKPLSGAVIGVFTEDGKTKITEATSNSEGKVSFSLDYGSYAYKEISAPTGYVKDDTLHKFKIESNGQIVKGELLNGNVKALVTIRKIDSVTKRPLEGVKFRIYAEDAKTVIADEVTNSQGFISLDINYGKYYYQEYETIDGYVLEDALHEFEVVDDGATLNFEATNRKISSTVEITKSDKVNNSKLEGAKFSIYAPDKTTVLKTGTTDINGKVTFKLDYGTYYYKEVEAPKGYVLDNNFYEINVTTDGAVIPFDVKNDRQQGSVLIKKTDENGKLLPGVEFALCNKTDRSIIEKKKTDSKGEVKFTADLGEYLYKETSTLPQYVLDTNYYPVNIATENQIIEETRVNTVVRSIIKVEKTDSESNAKLKGMEFAISKDSKVITTGITNEDGTAELTLPYGKYVFTETKPPIGYTLNSTPVNFEVTTNGAIIPIVIKNTKIGGTLEITKTDITNNKPLPNTKINIYDEDKKTVVLSGVTDSKGKLSFKLNYGKYYYSEVEAPAGYVIDSTLVPFEIRTDGQIIKANITNRLAEGGLELTKTDIADSKPLEGATFKIYSSDGKTVLKEGTTNENGVASFTLTYGKYFYEETTPPTGYVITSEKVPFEIKTDGEIIKATITNRKIKGSLELNKVDVADGSPIPDTEFTIYKEDGKTVVTSGKTDDKGYASFTLEYGKYYYKETVTHEGYVTNETLVPFEIKSDGEIIKQTVTNRKINGNIEISKVDIADDKPLPNTRFEILAEDGTTVVKEGKTDEQGKIVFNLDYGKYFYRETECPVGYTIDKNAYPFEIKTDGETIKAKVTNKYISGRLDITKIDEEGSPLSGAKFQILKEDKKTVVTTITSDSSGKCSVELPYGNYYYQELVPPTGYNVDDTLYPFTIDVEGKVITGEVKNDRITGQLELTKTDIVTSEGLPNTKFSIYAEDGTTLLREGITDENGKAIFNLEYGSYFYQESEAPEGYLIDENMYPFEIREDGEIVKANMTNKKKSGKLIITKRDTTTGETLENAGFVIYDKDKESVINKGVTDENGEIEFSLDYGTYYYQELKAPIGYQIDNSMYEIAVKEEGEVIEVSVVNNKLPKTGDRVSNGTLPLVITIVGFILGSIFIEIRRYRRD